MYQSQCRVKILSDTPDKNGNVKILDRDSHEADVNPDQLFPIDLSSNVINLSKAPYSESPRSNNRHNSGNCSQCTTVCVSVCTGSCTGNGALTASSICSTKYSNDDDGIEYFYQ